MQKEWALFMHLVSLLDYLFFIISDFIPITRGLKAERKLLTEEEEPRERKGEIKRIIRMDRIMRLMDVAANIAEFIIALASESNPYIYFRY